jgi:hypothetical protein
MKRYLYLLLFLLHTPVYPAFTPSLLAAGTTGLNYQTYAAGGAQPSYTQDSSGNITNRTLLSTGTVSTINYNWGGGGVLNSNRGDGVIVRFYGYINIATAGTYYFGGNADDGLRININNTSVVNSWIESGGTFRSGSIYLAAGTYPIEVMYYENGGGAMVNLQWYTTSGWQIVSSSYLATDSTYFAPAVPQYSSSITTQQQARVDAYRSRSYADASIHIDQVGDNNNIVIDQYARGTIKGIGQQDAVIHGNYNNITIRQGVTTDPGSNEINLRVVGDTNTLNLNQARTTQGTAVGTNGHYLSTDIYGSGNTLTTQQTNAGGVGGHYMETTITGNTNNVTAKQTDNGNKIMFVTATGNNNTVDAVQKDSGQHYLDLKLTGGNHSASVVQQGNTQNRATIELINGGGGAAIDMIQNGGSIYNITTTCVTAGGCAPITVRQ